MQNFKLSYEKTPLIEQAFESKELNGRFVMAEIHDKFTVVLVSANNPRGARTNKKTGKIILPIYYVKIIDQYGRNIVKQGACAGYWHTLIDDSITRINTDTNRIIFAANISILHDLIETFGYRFNYIALKPEYIEKHDPSISAPKTAWAYHFDLYNQIKNNNIFNPSAYDISGRLIKSKRKYAGVIEEILDANNVEYTSYTNNNTNYVYLQLKHGLEITYRKNKSLNQNIVIKPTGKYGDGNVAWSLIDNHEEFENWFFNKKDNVSCAKKYTSFYLDVSWKDVRDNNIDLVSILNRFYTAADLVIQN
jgi:hypothetical protein